MLISQLQSLAPQVEELTRLEATDWFGRWCAAFLEPVKLQTGKYRYRQLHWHAFSFGLVHSIQGKSALSAYESSCVEPIIVIPESWQDTCGARLLGARLPDFSSLLDDLYIFPESLDWTLVLTHESHCGPYFLCR